MSTQLHGNLSLTEEALSFFETRKNHHIIALDSYSKRFDRENLDSKYKNAELNFLNKVFTTVKLRNPLNQQDERFLDTFDLTNPRLATRVVNACYEFLAPKQCARCLRAINRYCSFLKVCPSIQIGDISIYLPDYYGPIESPVNKYTLPRQASNSRLSSHYLVKVEVEKFLQCAYKMIPLEIAESNYRRNYQIYLMAVIGMSMGLRQVELLALKAKHFRFEDNTCLVIQGKGSKGSGPRKRVVHVGKADQIIKAFISQFQIQPDEYLFQNRGGTQLSPSTAQKHFAELRDRAIEEGVIVVEGKGFNSHAMRRTCTRRRLESGETNLEKIMMEMGWLQYGTINNYMGKPRKP